MRRRHRLLFALLTALAPLGAASAHAQQYVPLTASHIVDSAGNPLTAGTLRICPVSNKGVPIAYHVGGGATATAQCATTPVTNGAVITQVADSYLALPQNVCFALHVQDPVTYAEDLPYYTCVQPSNQAGSPAVVAGWCTAGGSCNLDLYSPSIAALPVANVNGGTTVINNSGISLASAIPGQTLPGAEVLTSARPQLAAFLGAFANCQNQPVHVVVYGDSRTTNDAVNTGNAGYPSYAGKWTSLLRSKLLAAGCPSLGTGIVPIINTAGSTTPNADNWSVTSGSVVLDSSTGPYQTGNFAAAGSIGAGAGTTVSFTSSIAWDHLNGYCLKGVSFGAWNVAIDGTGVGTCGGNASVTSAALANFAAGSGLGTHTATFTCAASPCGMYAAQGVAGTAGVDVSNLAVGSSTAEWHGLNPAVQMSYSDLLPGGHQLDIIQEIANEPGVGYSTTSFSSALTNIITHDRALASGAPSFLLVAPMQDGIANQGPYYPVIASTATTLNTAFVDMRDQVGASQVNAYYVLEGSNLFHENTAGHAIEAQLIAAALFPNGVVGSGSGGGGGTGTYPTNISINHATITPSGNSAGALDWTGGSGSGYTLGLWAGNNGAGLNQGGMGLFQTASSVFPWFVNSAGDLIFQNPVSGGNVNAGTGAVARINHDGTVSGFGAGGVPVYGVPASITSPTGGSSVAFGGSGWPKTDHTFLFTVTTTGAVAAGNTIATITFGKKWYDAAGNLANPICSFASRLRPGDDLRLGYDSGPGDSANPAVIVVYTSGSSPLAANTGYAWAVTCDAYAER